MAEKTVPGRICVDHVGYSVPDLDQALDLFVNVFGCQIAFMGGPYDDAGYVWPGETEPEKTPMRLAVVTHGGTMNIELLEYDNPSQKDVVPPRPCEKGGAHICFYCEDIEGVAEVLRNREDVLVMGDVEQEEGGAIDGAYWIYTVTTWGLVIELIRWEPGKLPYEKNSSVRMVPPKWYQE